MMHNNLPVKAIVVDLDRTLLRADQTLSAYTVEVLQRCSERGIRVMIATARPQRTAKVYCDRLGVEAAVVANGARILCGGRKIECGIDPQRAASLLQALQSDPSLRITLETGDCSYANRPIAEYEVTLCEDLPAVAKAEGVLKILVHLDAPDTEERVRRHLTDDLYGTVSHGYLLQIMHRAATKWNGIQTMLQSCGCTPQETVYFGDDQDDVEPIRLCGIGVAVANAISEAKAAADEIADSNDADGVARWLARRVLINE